jgi:hypothetical protein
MKDIPTPLLVTIGWAATMAAGGFLFRGLAHWQHTRRARRLASQELTHQAYAPGAKRALHAGVNAVQIGDDLVEVSSVHAEHIFGQAHAKTTRLHAGLFRRLAAERTPGQVAYEGYLGSCGGKSLVSGADLPKFDKQDESIRIAWESAALAVLRQYRQGKRAEMADCIADRFERHQ